MELKIECETAKYYANTPWVLANQIWIAHYSADSGADDLCETFTPYRRRNPITLIEKKGTYVVVEVGVE